MMEDVKRRFRITATTFHITSMRPMPRYSFFSLGIRTTACQVASSARSPYLKVVCTNSTTLAQFSAPSRVSYRPPPSLSVVSPLIFPIRATAIHSFRSSARIHDVPPARLLRRRLTAHSISPSSGTPYFTSKDSISTGMLSPGGGIHLYSATLSAIIRLSVSQAGGGARSTAALYHP